MTTGPTTEAVAERPEPDPPARVREHSSWPIILMVLGGALLAAQARVNGELHDRLGGTTPVAVLVALVSFAVGTLVVLAALFASARARRALKELPVHIHELRWWFFLGGIGGATLVSVSAAAVPIIGVALLSVCTVAGQTAGSLAVDEFGLGPGGRRPITTRRAVGAIVAVGALLLATVGHPRGDFSIGLVIAITIAGVLVAGQVAVNGQLAVSTREPRIAAAVSFIGGTLVLAALTGVFAGTGRLHDLDWPNEFWLYLGGIGGAIYIVLGAATVAGLGVLRLSLASVAGQLLASVMLDVFAPAPGEGLAATTIVGVFLTFVAVAITASSRTPTK